MKTKTGSKKQLMGRRGNGGWFVEYSISYVFIVMVGNNGKSEK